MPETSAQRKLTWGVKRIHELGREALTFEHADAYVPRVQREPRAPYEIKYRVFAEERQPPSPDWPLMAGEAIQAVRSALEHAVYTAARGRGKPQFPIFTDPCEFQVIGSRMIRRVPKAIRTLIEEAQPYKRLPSAPDLDTLAVLADLSNHDKHRTLVTVASGIDFSGVGTQAHIKVKWEMFPFEEDTLYNDAEIAVFTAKSDREIREMDVDPRFTYRVMLERRPLVATLVDFAKRAFEVIKEIETGQPISPLEQGYPIQQPLPGRHLDGSPIR